VWVFLDEATAALDEAAEQRMYQLLTERLPEATMVRIAHGPDVARFTMCITPPRLECLPVVPATGRRTAQLIGPVMARIAASRSLGHQD
jgi:hypothetical protein